jgi:DNA-binding MarR family transcriptional regulator
MPTSEETARSILEVIPLVMRTIRHELRSNRALDVSVPQFRVLSFIRRNPQTSLTDLADYIGLTLPSISKMVDGLVERGWVSRVECAADRRKVTLTLTAAGETMLAASNARTQERLSRRLTELSNSERANITDALATLQDVFSASSPLSGNPAENGHPDPQA